VPVIRDVNTKGNSWQIAAEATTLALARRGEVNHDMQRPAYVRRLRGDLQNSLGVHIRMTGTISPVAYPRESDVKVVLSTRVHRRPTRN